MSLRSNYSVTPGLAVVMVGDRGDSKSYVESKKKACADVGFESYHTTLSGNISEELLLKVGASKDRPVLVSCCAINTWDKYRYISGPKPRNLYHSALQNIMLVQLS